MAGLDDLSLDQLERLKVQRLALDKAGQYGLDADMFTRQIKQESGFNPHAVSPAGAIGPGQLMPGTAHDLGVDPNDPEQNIDGAARYMRQNLDRFGGDPRLALAAYHAGPGSAEAALRNPEGNPKTNAYVNAIAGDAGGPDLDSMSLEQLQALRSQVVAQQGPPKRPAAPPMKPKPPVLTDAAKGAAGGAIRAGAGIPDMIGQGPGSVPFFLNLGGSAAGALGAPNVATSLHAIAGEMSNPIGKAAKAKIPLASYEAQTLPGKVAEKVGEFLPGALIPGSAGTRIASVVAPAVGAVGGREIVKASGGSERAQSVGEFVGAILGGGASSMRAPKLGMKSAAPTLEDLKGNVTTAYRAVDAAGIKYKPNTIDKLLDGIEADLADNKFNPARHRESATMLKELEKLRGEPLTPTQLDQMRQVVRRDVAGIKTDDADAFFGQRMIAKIDEFTDKVGGGPQLSAARAANTRYKKVEAVSDAMERAQNRAGASGGGGNIDNAIRSQMRGVLENTRNLTPAETKALKSIVRGDKMQNIARVAGKASPTNGIVPMAANVILAKVTGGASIPISMGLKAIADQTTVTKVERLVDLMARGGKAGLDAEDQLAIMAHGNPAIGNVYRQVARVLIPAAATATALPAAARPQSQQPPRKPASQR
jgi:hypothetical protein